MPGLEPMSHEEYVKQEEEGERAFNMTLAGLGMILASILFGIFNLIFGAIVRSNEREREERIRRDGKIAGEGKTAARELAASLSGRSDYEEQMLSAYREHRRTKSIPWVQGFWAGVYNLDKRYIESQFDQHPEWVSEHDNTRQVRGYP